MNSAAKARLPTSNCGAEPSPSNHNASTQCSHELLPIGIAVAGGSPWLFPVLPIDIGSPAVTTFGNKDESGTARNRDNLTLKAVFDRLGRWPSGFMQRFHVTEDTQTNTPQHYEGRIRGKGFGTWNLEVSEIPGHVRYVP